MTSTITSNLNNVSDEVIAHSTTKALMLCITVPRVYRVYVPPKTTVVAAAAEDGTALSITPTQNNEPPSSGNTACSNNAEEAKTEGEQVVAEEKAVVEEKVEEKVVIEEKVIIVNIPESPEIKVGRKKVGGKTEAENENASKIEENGENDEDHDDKIEEEDSMTEVGYVEEHSHREGVPVVDHVVTQEEMATIVKIDPNARDEDAASGDENSKGAINETAESTEDGATKSVEESVVSKAMKLFYGVAGLKRDDPIYMSRDEAVAAMKGFESFKKESEDSTAPNTEIRVEALVRLTFRNLRSEGHFYNAPIYTGVESPKKDGEGVDEWIELTVMVKDASIGIILERLERIGVGSTVGSISIYKAELCRAADLVSPNPISVSTRGESKDQKEGEDGVTGNPKIEAARMAWKNAASRLRVEQVKEQIHEQAVMSFDFLALLTIASILAGIGLITDSTVVIVASMLVSPIMGPVMGMTFGSRVLDWKLAKSSFVVEIAALLLCVLVGAIIGFSAFWTEIGESWPTGEMESRGDITGLLTGIAIAIPSGMGVALSILGNNTASLVGVAISASLLPPAVNAGICWAHAILIRAGTVDNIDEADFAKIGGISFALTVVNIFCIWIFGMVMFAIKEVAPSQSKSAFWSRDIKTARAIKKGSKEVDLDKIKAGLQEALEKERKAGAPEKQPRRLNVKRSPRKNSTFGFNMTENPADDLVMEEFIGPTPLIDDVRYIGLEDMGALLGFDEEHQDVEEGPRTWSWLRMKRN